jgi:RNase P/RNase MRP subunit p30
MNTVEFKRRPVNQVYSCDMTGDHSGVYVLASEYDTMKARAEDAEQKLELANRAMIETNKRSVMK